MADVDTGGGVGPAGELVPVVRPGDTYRLHVEASLAAISLAPDVKRWATARLEDGACTVTLRASTPDGGIVVGLDVPGDKVAAALAALLKENQAALDDALKLGLARTMVAAMTGGA